MEHLRAIDLSTSYIALLRLRVTYFLLSAWKAIHAKLWVIYDRAPILQPWMLDPRARLRCNLINAWETCSIYIYTYILIISRLASIQFSYFYFFFSLNSYMHFYKTNLRLREKSHYPLENVYVLEKLYNSTTSNLKKET